VTLTPSERTARWRALNPERARENRRRQNARHRKLHPEQIRERRALYTKLYPERARESRARWSANNPKKDSEWQAKRRSAKLQAMPSWADKEKIAEIYKRAGELGHDVDHIVPLVSLKVCGLHVQDNLQTLPSAENQRKGNRWWPDMFEENPSV